MVGLGPAAAAATLNMLTKYPSTSQVDQTLKESLQVTGLARSLPTLQEET